MTVSGDSKSLPQALDQIRAALRAISHADSDAVRKEQTENLLAAVFGLGIEVHNNPSLRQSPELAAFLLETASSLPALMPDIARFIRVTENIFYRGWDGGEWVWACKRRSGLEFLFGLYSGTSFAQYLADADLSDLDGLLRERGHQEGYLSTDEIPAGIPPSHWWWWYPAPPPAGGGANG